MEFTFTIKRVLLLLALIGVFALLGGFQNPASGIEMQHPRMGRAWLICVLMFLSGAVSTTIVDHVVGLMDRTSIRWLYIFAGVLLMGGALLWLSVLRSAAESA
jgi:hypothetical protein